MISLVKTNFNVGIIVVLVVGLLVGYVVYPFINPSQKQTTQTQDSKTAPQSDWTTFSDEQYGISFDYPKSWSVESSTQVFENGDVVAVQILGETQQAQTEFYDGARLVVMIPEATKLDLADWVASKHQGMPSENPPQVTDVQINGRAFKKVDECGLGCFSYYYTLVSGKVYGVMTSASGPQKIELETTLEQMLAKLELGK